MTLIDEFRMLADDLYSVEGHNRYASALSKAADEIERLQSVIAGLRAELITDADIGASDSPEAKPLYLAPGAQPKLDEIKIALHRALELGKRETWTGAKKYRSREDQCEEQQCWDKVWNLLGAKGE